MTVEHVSFEHDATAVIIISRTKSDVDGTGRVAHLSRETTSLLSRWIKAGGREERCSVAELLFAPLPLQ